MPTKLLKPEHQSSLLQPPFMQGDCSWKYSSILKLAMFLASWNSSDFDLWFLILIDVVFVCQQQKAFGANTICFPVLLMVTLLRIIWRKRSTFSGFARWISFSLFCVMCLRSHHSYQQSWSLITSHKRLWHTLINLQGTKSSDYKQLLERKALITKQLQQQNQHKKKGESICSWALKHKEKEHAHHQETFNTRGTLIANK